MSLVSAWFFIIPWLRHLPASQFSFNVVSLRRFAGASGWGWAMLPRWFRWWMGWYRWYLKQVPAAADILERLCLWPGDRWLWDDRYMSWMSRSRGTGGKQLIMKQIMSLQNRIAQGGPRLVHSLCFIVHTSGKGWGTAAFPAGSQVILDHYVKASPVAPWRTAFLFGHI